MNIEFIGIYREANQFFSALGRLYSLLYMYKLTYRLDVILWVTNVWYIRSAIRDRLLRHFTSFFTRRRDTYKEHIVYMPSKTFGGGWRYCHGLSLSDVIFSLWSSVLMWSSRPVWSRNERSQYVQQYLSANCRLPALLLQCFTIMP